MHAKLGVVFLLTALLVGCPREPVDPVRASGTSCDSYLDCVPDGGVACGTLLDCVDRVCAATPSLVLPCP